MIDLAGEDGEVDQPELAHLDYLMEALRVAEELGWHHCPPGTLEGDHYERLAHRVKEEQWKKILKGA